MILTDSIVQVYHISNWILFSTFNLICREMELHKIVHYLMNTFIQWYVSFDCICIFTQMLEWGFVQSYIKIIWVKVWHLQIRNVFVKTTCTALKKVWFSYSRCSRAVEANPKLASCMQLFDQFHEALPQILKYVFLISVYSILIKYGFNKIFL